MHAHIYTHTGDKVTIKMVASDKVHTRDKVIIHVAASDGVSNYKVVFH